MRHKAFNNSIWIRQILNQADIDNKICDTFVCAYYPTSNCSNDNKCPIGRSVIPCHLWKRQKINNLLKG